MPTLHSGEGTDLSPPLSWEGEPPGTGAYALVLDDPDAPDGIWIHWVLFNIPASQHSLGAGLPRRLELTNGARHGRCWGVNRFSRIGYYGPLPPAGPPHRYRFTLTALDGPLDLRPGATPFEVAHAVQIHGLGDARLEGCYARQLVGSGARQVQGPTL
jgi:hypothetical protein